MDMNTQLRLLLETAVQLGTLDLAGPQLGIISLDGRSNVKPPDIMICYCNV